MNFFFSNILSFVPGVCLVSSIAVAATALSMQLGGPELLYALILGGVFFRLNQSRRLVIGINFCTKTLLRLGVGLLGVRITAEQITVIGWFNVALILIAVVTTFLFGALLAKILGMTRNEGILSGGSVAICGASAALAIAAVMPKNKTNERFTYLVIVTVTALSTLAMFLYPVIAQVLELDSISAGVFLGGTIHDVAQVVGAGYTLGSETGDFATIVKLFRVSLLGVVVVFVSFILRFAYRTAELEKVDQPLIPWFVWLFVLLLLANSFGLIAGGVQTTFSALSKTFLLVAITAIGIKTSITELISTGWRPFFLIVAETAFLGCFVLVSVFLFRSSIPA